LSSVQKNWVQDTTQNEDKQNKQIHNREN
jgi:hypothetical protein